MSSRVAGTHLEQPVKNDQLRTEPIELRHVAIQSVLTNQCHDLHVSGSGSVSTRIDGVRGPQRLSSPRPALPAEDDPTTVVLAREAFDSGRGYVLGLGFGVIRPGFVVLTNVVEALGGARPRADRSSWSLSFSFEVCHSHRFDVFDSFDISVWPRVRLVPLVDAPALYFDDLPSVALFE
ncbi:hypothetical protein R1flu_022993 [Riccia fluitans]|uniref:Uncharacterized protein n=1 Tax=Riccia fluitans TaxID=41844 RepID=A0ABD1XQV5_9MARC